MKTRIRKIRLTEAKNKILSLMLTGGILICKERKSLTWGIPTKYYLTTRFGDKIGWIESKRRPMVRGDQVRKLIDWGFIKKIWIKGLNSSQTTTKNFYEATSKYIYNEKIYSLP